MPGVSEEQVARAREIDLLSYLQAYEPGELKPDGPGRYTTVTHGSLVISNGKWNWNAGGVAGVSALDYLIKVQGMGFVAAVEHLTGERADYARICHKTAKSQPPSPKRPFRPPKPYRYATNAVSYLQNRGIYPEVIRQCIQLGILYESRYCNPQSEYHNAPVCVFAGKDEYPRAPSLAPAGQFTLSGEVRFAAMRGISADFKRDKAGSDKRFNFHIPAKNPHSRHLTVFEAPIDAMSHASLQRRNGWAWDGHRLSLGGTSDVALIAFLERNPQINRIILHLDNDVAGITAARKIKARLAADSRYLHIRVSINPPHRGANDYNDLLLRDIQHEREQKHHSRREAAISI